MKVHFITFGCKVNLYETENMKQRFTDVGYEVLSSEKDCDIYVVNSCTVTGEGDKKLFKELRRLRRENPTAIIVLTGCFPQAFENEAAALSEVDIITGTKNRGRLTEIISEYISERYKRVEICGYDQGDKFEDMCNTGYTDNTRAFIKIQDGCNMFCSYCIIPYSRGRFRSKPLDRLITEVKGLSAAGYREFVLVGINLSFYGAEFGKRLADAVEAVCSVEGVERVRLGSLEPEVISDEDIRRLAALESFCPQFHLSLQSGCDRTLKAMNRHYTADEYRKLVGKLRAAFDNAAITTDIMVGFPGETDEDFEQSLEFVDEIGFAKVHVFPYSRRKGTPAAEMSDQISSEIKSRRAAKMIETAEQCRIKFLETQIGRVVPVLFEREKTDGIPHGYTPNYTLVKLFTKNLDKSLRNQIFYVKIIRLESDYCIGKFTS